SGRHDHQRQRVPLTVTKRRFRSAALSVTIRKTSPANKAQSQTPRSAMPPFDQDLKDPKLDVLERTMASAVVTANGKARIGLMTPNPAEYAKFATKEYPAAPEGVAIWLSDQGRVEPFPPTPRATLLGVVWRTTPIGRQLRVVGRRIEPFAESPSHRFGPPWRKWPPLCLFEHDHVI